MYSEPKPIAMADKEYLINILSTKTGIEHDIIHTVIQDTFLNLISQFPFHKEMEISGLGKFIFREKAAKQTIEFYEKRVKENMYTPKILPAIEDRILYLKNKV